MIKASASLTPLAEQASAAERTGSPASDRRLARLFLRHSVLATLAGMGLILCLCGLSGATVDRPVAQYALTRPAYVHEAAVWISDLGLSGYMLVGSALAGVAALALRRRERRSIVREGLSLFAQRALLVFAAVAVSGLLVQVLKHLFGRARPKLMEQWGPFHFDLFSLKASLASFPSGHATSIFALAVSLGLVMPRARWPLIILAFLVSASRVLVGSHYVSDVIAGAALGSLTAVTLAIWFAARGIVFTRLPDTLRLNGRGRVGPALGALVRRYGMAS